LKKSRFKNVLAKRRCIVLTSGCYEWSKDGKLKVPYRFCVKDEPWFGMAGLRDACRNPAGELVPSFTIITTEANALVAPHPQLHASHPK
jgi:putative SOS response-associated peptidase YedK